MLSLEEADLELNPGWQRHAAGQGSGKRAREQGKVP